MTESRIGQLEYYSELDTSGSLRSYLFEWPTGFELGGLSYEVQEPATAADLRISPAADAQSPGAFGLTYYTADLGPQTVGR